MSTLFENLSDAKFEHPPILLIDTSYSVTTAFNETTIFDKMLEIIISKINADEFRIIFWNSNNSENDNFHFINGINKVVTIINKKAISQFFKITKAKITKGCLTFPHLGISNISPEWIHDTKPTHIYFITDGQIGYGGADVATLNYLKTKLKNNIEELFLNSSNIHFHIISVENTKHNFNDSETIEIMAGGDVYKVIQNNNLTKYITEFTSYNLINLDGYTHLKNIIAPKGYVPFMNECFPESKTNEFILYLSNLVKSTTDEDELLKIIQNLSNTLKVLTTDKSKNIVTNILNTFSNIFKNTLIEPSLVNFILIDTIKLEHEGKAIIFSEYRSKLKTLYKTAGCLLTQNFKNAIGLNDNFITLPIGNIITTGHESAVIHDFIIKKEIFTNASVQIDNCIIPVIPARFDLTSFNEQCVRQHIRAIISQQYGDDRMSDIVIYRVLALILQIVLSDIDEMYKLLYINLGIIMLRKKRLNSDISELDKLREGNLPIPNNGKMEHFYQYMQTMSQMLKINCKPMTLFYAICLALRDTELIKKQLIHCVSDIKSDYPDIKPEELLNIFGNILDKITIYNILGDNVEYRCIISLEDCTNIGGYKFLPHSFNLECCKPNFMLSYEGYNSFFTQPNTVCPACYTYLTPSDFEMIGPKVILNDTVFPENIKDPFKNAVIKKPEPIINNSSNVSSNVSSANNNFIVIKMKGTVGSGKTTYANKIKQYVENNGGYCLIEGIDKYCKNGMSVEEASNQIRINIAELFSNNSPYLVLIIDTCGENSDATTHFGHDLSKFKNFTITPNFYNKLTILEQYMSWSLRNVLNREMCTPESTYWLNHHSVGVSKCVDINYRKTRNIFGKKAKMLFTNTQNLTLNEVLSKINDNADIYENLIKSCEKPLEIEIGFIVDFINKLK